MVLPSSAGGRPLQLRLNSSARSDRLFTALAGASGVAGAVRHDARSEGSSVTSRFGGARGGYSTTGSMQFGGNALVSKICAGWYPRQVGGVSVVTAFCSMRLRSWWRGPMASQCKVVSGRTSFTVHDRLHALGQTTADTMRRIYDRTRCLAARQSNALQTACDSRLSHGIVMAWDGMAWPGQSATTVRRQASSVQRHPEVHVL